MDGPLNLAELRATIEGQRTAISYNGLELTGTPEGDAKILDALIDAVEAAYAYITDDTEPNARDPYRLVTALAHFDFGEA